MLFQFNHLLKKATGSFFLKAGSMLLGFIATIIFANLLSVEDFGIYIYVFSVASLVSVIAKFGIQRLIIRETAVSLIRNEWGYIKGIWLWAIRKLFVTSILGVCAYLAFIVSMDVAGKYIFPAQYGALLIPLMVFASLRVGVMQGVGYVFLAHYPEQVFRPLLFILISLGYSSFFTLNPEVLVSLHVLAWFLVSLIGGYQCIKLIPSQIYDVKSEYDQQKKWFKSLVPLGLTAILFQVNTYVDVILLGIWVAPEKIAYYKVAVQFSLLMTIGLQVVEMFASRLIAELSSNGEVEQLQKLVCLCSLGATVFSIVIFVSFCFVGDSVIAYFFGDAYFEALPIIVLLGLGQIVSAYYGPQGPLAAMTNYEYMSAKCVMLSALVNICLNCMLIPLYGVTGAAVATVFSMILKNVLFWFVYLKKTGVDSRAKLI